MNNENKYEKKRLLIEELSGLVTSHRFARMQQVLNGRTRHITAVLEDVHRSPNSNAAIRSLECFGIQDVYLVEGKFKAKLDDAIAKGATQWTTIKHYKGDGQDACLGIEQCFKDLKAQGYVIVATSPHAQGYTLPQLPIDSKIAVVFGNEEAGISNFAQENADAHVKIPMYGFTESFNIAASVAIVAYDLVRRLKNSPIAWELTQEEKLDVLIDWLYATGKALRPREDS